MIGDLVGEILESPAEVVMDRPESGPLIRQDRMQPSLRLIRRDREIRKERGFDDPVLCFLVGSMNKNVRSMALDAEAVAQVADAWAMQAYLDFELFSGGVDWIDSLEELDELLPPYPRHPRWMARYIQYLL